MPRKKIPRNIGLARNLRKTMTLPEILLWQRLYKDPDGVKFRRQYSIDPYVLDFYCAKAKVALEVDGFVHDMETIRSMTRSAMLFCTSMASKLYAFRLPTC